MKKAINKYSFLLLFFMCFLFLPSFVLAAWTLETVDDQGDVGAYSSMAFDLFFNAHISYYDAVNGSLKHAVQQIDPSGSWSWFTETIETGGAHGVGQYSSLAIDSTNRIHISYYDADNRALKYATKYHVGSWQTGTIDTRENPPCIIHGVGEYSSLAVDSTNRVHISYYDDCNGNIKYATKPYLGTWDIMIIASGGPYSSISIDFNDKVHVSFYDGGSLKYATNASGIWVTETVDARAGENVGQYCDLAIDSNYKAHISYYDYSNKSLKYATNVTGSWTAETIDTSELSDVGQYSSIDLDLNNYAHIIYFDHDNNDLKYATNATGSWVIETVDAGGGRYGSIVVNVSNNNGRIDMSHYDGKLRYATNVDFTHNCPTSIPCLYQPLFVDIEPNNDRDSAVIGFSRNPVLTPPAYFYGYIETPDDEDWYQVYVYPEHTIDLAMSNENTGTDVDWVVINPSGYVGSVPYTVPIGGQGLYALRIWNNNGGVIETRYDFNVTVTPKSDGYCPSPLAGVAASYKSNNDIVLSWPGSVDIKGPIGYGICNLVSGRLLGTTTATSFNIENLTSGLHRYAVVAGDPAGNFSEVSTIEVLIEAIPPVTTANPPTGTYTSAQEVILSCDDGSGTGCQTTYYCLGTGCDPTTVYNGPINISSSTDLRFYSTDKATNSESIKTETYTITIPQVTHTITASAGANGSISPSGAVTVNHTATRSFNVSPNNGYQAVMSGTCGGNLVGTTYTTNPITADCTVIASFNLTSSNHDLSPGNNVQVSVPVPLPSGGTGTVLIELDQIVTGGTLNVSATDTPIGGSLPTGFKFLGTYYDVTFTGSFSGYIYITFPYKGSSISSGKEKNLKLFHWENGSWKDVTVSVNTGNNTITGRVTSLSPFGMGYSTSSGSGSAGSGYSTGANENMIALIAILAISVGIFILRRRRKIS